VAARTRHDGTPHAGYDAGHGSAGQKSMSEQGSREAPASEQLVKTMFAALAVGSILAAAAVYLLRGAFGIADDTARNVATAFVLAAMADGLVLYFWDRLFKRPK
jgi:hypothetical protein